MDELTSADILVILQAVESLVEQSAEFVAPDFPILRKPCSFSVHRCAGTYGMYQC